MIEKSNGTSKYDNLSLEVKEVLLELNNNLVKEFNLVHAELKKPKKRILLLVSIILFSYAVIFLIIFIMISISDKEELTKSNTKELYATISKIQSSPFYVRLEEYDALITIYNQDVVIDSNILINLSVRQTITFRIREYDIDSMYQMSNQVEIVSLKVNDIDIITLDSYNEVNKETNIVIFIIIFGIFLTGAIVCLMVSRHQNTIKESKKQFNFINI